MEEKQKPSIQSVIHKQLVDRCWGVAFPSNQNRRPPKFLITDFRGLALATGIIRYYNKDKNTSVFYRGQLQDWPLKPSAYRHCTTRNDCDTVDEWIKRVLDCIKSDFDLSGTDSEREALAQHYGLKTRYIDVVDHIQTALWFACDAVEQGDPKYDDGVGYIQAIVVPNTYEIIDLREKSSEWLRPHIQQAFSIKAPNPKKQNGLCDELVVAKFIISKENLRHWSNYEYLSKNIMYPPAIMDKGAYYWNNALKHLMDENLLSLYGTNKSKQQGGSPLVQLSD